MQVYLIMNSKCRILQEECKPNWRIQLFLHHCIFNINDIKTAVFRLKAHKNEGNSDLLTDNIIHAGNDCLLHIAFSFTSMVVHGSAPECFKLSTIVPIPNVRNYNSTDSTDFRGIALSSIYGKLLNYIILERFHDKFVSSDLQFGAVRAHVHLFLRKLLPFMFKIEPFLCILRCFKSF